VGVGAPASVGEWGDFDVIGGAMCIATYEVAVDRRRECARTLNRVVDGCIDGTVGSGPLGVVWVEGESLLRQLDAALTPTLVSQGRPAIRKDFGRHGHRGGPMALIQGG
jgi:hypothetical protein